MTQNSDLEQWRILLVESNPDISQTIFSILGSSVDRIFAIQTVPDLAGAIDRISSQTYDMVLLNLFLPDSAGIKTLKKLRALKKYLPVIVLVPDDDMNLVDSATDFNIRGFLVESALEAQVLIPMLEVSIQNSRKEKKNRLEENKFRDIIENLDDAYYENDLKGTYLYVNKASSGHFDRPREELIGSTYKANTPKHLQKKILNTFTKIYQTGKSGKIVDNEIVRPDGSIMYTEISVSLMKNENGKVIGFSGISRDVTEKKKAQQKVKESEEKHRTILEGMEDAYFEVDFDGNLLFFNHSLCKMLGYDYDELMHRRYTTYMDNETAKQMARDFIDIFNTNKSKFLQYEIYKKDGSVRYHEATVSLMLDKNDEPVGFRGVSRDLTENKKAEQELKLSEEKYRNILTSIEDGYFEVDLKGRLTFINESMTKIFGYSRKELISSSHREYMDKKSADKLSEAYGKIFKSGKSNRSLEYGIIRKDGAKSYLENSVTLMKDQDDRVIGFRGIARDITQRKQFVRELKLAKKGAEEASLAKSEFLANMSHEIRTPMNGVIGMYNLLLSTDLTAEQGDYALTGKRSADALLSVINDILDFSKIEAGKLDIEVIDFDLRKSVEEIVALPAVQAHTKGLEFAYQIDHDVNTLIKGDPGRLRQIITNLSTNAIKFTSEGEVVFRVVMEEETDTTITLHFSIQDTGIGISKKDQVKLFNSFQQVDASTTRKYGGTGLGLAISKKLVELMGGSIHVDSIPGKGSTFWFTSVFEKQGNVVEREYENLESIQDKRILIVDDNQTNLDILCGYLTHWGCSCDQALSGDMALSLMRAVVKAKAPYDLVISDMLMPKMDGSQLGRIIKMDPQLRDVQMIMLTSQGLRGDAAQMKEIGYAAYLNKPVRRSLLYDCMVTVVNRTHPKPGDTQKKELVTSYSLSEDKRHSLKILLAEDNPVNRKVATHLLKKFGFQVDTANNGKEALEALKTKDYQVVLMDIQMPQMDGIEATGVIRDENSGVLNHDVLIIAMTAHAMKGDRDMCIKAGMNDYISKPVKPNSLLDVIERNAENLV